MNMNKYNYLKIEAQDGACIVSINREDKLNALNSDVLSELLGFFNSVDTSAYSSIILTGSGEKSFIAGADIQAMRDMDPKAAMIFTKLGQDTTIAIERCSIPVIAAVNGFCLGGGLEIALSCDFIFATENGLFGLPEVSLGLIPGFGGTQRLKKFIGLAQAKLLIYTAKRINTLEAHVLGLVTEVFSSKEEMITSCLSINEQMKKNSPLAIKCAKRALDKNDYSSMESGLSGELTEFLSLFESYDMREGTGAFVEKRKPQFKGI